MSATPQTRKPKTICLECRECRHRIIAPADSVGKRCGDVSDPYNGARRANCRGILRAVRDGKDFEPCQDCNR